MTDLELYEKAKEAYYNGTPILEDYEFDELEEKLGLSNKSYVGAKKNPSYTIEHPFIMGSLSKIQIKKDDNDNIDWDKYVDELEKYVFYNGKHLLFDNIIETIVTPKYDGCSFEAVVKNGKIVSISSRGDGYFGKDLYKHLIYKFNDYIINGWNEYTLRGEVLIRKDIFKEKYSEFVNPRSFVSGVLNRDYDKNDVKFIEMVSDLSIVIYDVRHKENGIYRDYDWDMVSYRNMPNSIDDTPTFYKHIEFTNKNRSHNINEFKKLYDEFSKYREKCEFALDGFVIKPNMKYRENNTKDARPKDCVAIKFIPMLEETEIVDIEWSSTKTNELHPVIIVKPVYMDGKQITRASGHNYGYMLKNKLSVGSKVILSLAGDIIPFIYKITNTEQFSKSKMCIPNKELYVDGVHLCEKLSENELNKKAFLNSALALGIPNIGPSIAERIFDYYSNNDKYNTNNILLMKPVEIRKAIGGKNGENVEREMKKYLENISLKDIIVSCCFESCGDKVSEQIVNQILFGKGDFLHLSEKAYSWCFNENSKEMKKVNEIFNFLGMNWNTLKENQSINENDNKIPIIMTGSPVNYKTKSEFLKANSQYIETGSWKEAQILFTGDLNSKSSKMEKAKKLNIKIMTY